MRSGRAYGSQAADNWLYHRRCKGSGLALYSSGDSRPSANAISHGKSGGQPRAAFVYSLVFAGIAWLVAVELFIRFFDQYLSRN